MSNSLAIAGNTHALKDETGQRARPFTAELRTHLYRGKKARLSSVVGALIAKAESGDIAAIKEIADRIEGKVSSNDTNPVRVYVVKDLTQLLPIDVTPQVVTDQEDTDGQT